MNWYLIPALKETPSIISRLIARIPDERLCEPTYPDRFSPLEIVCHLADWEPIMREERIRLAVNEPGSSFLAYDEGERAVALAYNEMDMEEQLRLWAIERAETVAFVRGLQPEDWAKMAHHPERGDMSVSDMVNMIVGHDVYHIEQLTAVMV